MQPEQEAIVPVAANALTTLPRTSLWVNNDLA